MAQKVEDKVWKEFETAWEMQERGKEAKAIIQNSQKPQTDWMRKVVDKVRISDLAREAGIDRCPLCEGRGKSYDIYFDDSRGWFICKSARWNKDCDFKGNIVDFENFILEGKKW